MTSLTLPSMTLSLHLMILTLHLMTLTPQESKNTLAQTLITTPASFITLIMPWGHKTRPYTNYHICLQYTNDLALNDLGLALNDLDLALNDLDLALNDLDPPMTKPIDTCQSNVQSPANQSQLVLLIRPHP